MAASSSPHPDISSRPVLSGQSRRSDSGRTSLITTDFTTTTKHAVERITHGCWACESAHPRRTDHVHDVAKTDMDMQILAFQISNAIENGIILCGLCRGGLDDHLNPAWVFYPSDLNYFIEFELADRQSRVMNPRPRKVPDSVAYLQHQKTISAVSEDAQEPLYVRRVLAPGDSASVRLIQGERGWHGHPIAAIRSAWRALGALRGNSIPLEDRAQLLYLLDLYRTPLDEHVVPPANLPSLPSIPPSPSNDQDPDDDADKKGKGKGKQVQTRVTKRPAPQETQKTVAGKRGKRGLAGVRKGKSHPLRKSVVGPEVKNQEPTNIIHWLNEVEGRTPPTAPPTPERD